MTAVRRSGFIPSYFGLNFCLTGVRGAAERPLAQVPEEDDDAIRGGRLVSVDLRLHFASL